jgi:hypothetical protein
LKIKRERERERRKKKRGRRKRERREWRSLDSSRDVETSGFIGDKQTRTRGDGSEHEGGRGRGRAGVAQTSRTINFLNNSQSKAMLEEA